jgi:hypothetical protein
MELKNSVLVMVDISGYTNFIRQQNLSLLHAEDIITQLLEAVIDAAQYPLILNKLEGDAAFLYAPSDGDPTAVTQDVLRQTMAFFTAFRRRAMQLSQDTAKCDCSACTNIARLKLKAFLHYGEIVIKKVRQFEELAGENVILIHHLLKNTIPADEYIVLTQPFYDLVGEVPDFRRQTHQEKREGSGEITVEVFYPNTDALLPIRVEASAARWLGRKASQMIRMVRHFLGTTQHKHFNHIPNHRVRLREFLNGE